MSFYLSLVTMHLLMGGKMTYRVNLFKFSTNSIPTSKKVWLDFKRVKQNPIVI